MRKVLPGNTTGKTSRYRRRARQKSKDVRRSQAAAKHKTRSIAATTPTVRTCAKTSDTSVPKTAKTGSTKPPKPASPPQTWPATLKPERKVKLRNGRTIEIGGLSGELAKRFVWCREGKRFVLTHFADWHGGGGDASRKMRDHGLVIVGGMKLITEAVDQLKKFPSWPIISRSGWSPCGFALPDGQVLVAEGRQKPLKDFLPVAGILGQAGTLEGWVERVASPLADHLIGSFFMMAMFAAPLLRLTGRTDNFGFELAGEAGRGKSTLQLLMASAAGPAVGASDTTYWRSLNSTINSLETMMAAFNDLPLILDEAGLVPGSGNADTRAAAMRELTFRLSAGRPKSRLGEAEGPPFRTISIISTNRPVASLLGPDHAAEGEAIADRLITISLNDRRHGIFDICPPSYAATGQFADALKQAAGQHCGQALPAYLAFLVDEDARKPQQLRDRIACDVANFLTRAGVNINNGSDKRVGEAVGLVYAAGRQAKRAGVLPPTYRCLKAALTALQVHRAHGRVPLVFDDKLRAVMAHPDTIDLAKTPISSLSKDQLNRCPCYLYTRRSGGRELIVPIKYIARVFPGWDGFKNDADVTLRLRKASDRIALERPIGPKGKVRPCYVFDVVDLDL